MPPDAIAFVCVPPITADRIEALSRLPQSGEQESRRVGVDMQFQAQGCFQLFAFLVLDICLYHRRRNVSDCANVKTSRPK